MGAKQKSESRKQKWGGRDAGCGMRDRTETSNIQHPWPNVESLNWLAWRGRLAAGRVAATGGRGDYSCGITPRRRVGKSCLAAGQGSRA